MKHKRPEEVGMTMEEYAMGLEDEIADNTERLKRSEPKLSQSSDKQWRDFYEKKAREQRKQIAELQALAKELARRMRHKPECVSVRGHACNCGYLDLKLRAEAIGSVIGREGM